MNRLDKHRERMHKQANSIGNFLVEGFHYLGLFAIGGAIAIASVSAFFENVAKGSAKR